MFLKCVHFLASYTSIVSVRAPLDRLELKRRCSRLSTVDEARRDRPAELHTARASAPPARAFDERIDRPLDTALHLVPSRRRPPRRALNVNLNIIIVIASR